MTDDRITLALEMEIYSIGYSFLEKLFLGEDVNLNPEQQTFSNSKINTYITCPAMYYLKYKRNLISGWQNDNLVYGEIIHKTLEIFYLCFNKDKSVDDSYKAAKRYLLKKYAKSGIKHTIKTTEAGLKFLKDVINFGLHLKGKVTPEKTLVYSNILPGIDLTGRLDLTVETFNEKSIYDFKTVAKKGDYYYIREHPNRQYKTYAFLSKTNSLYLIALHCVKNPNACAPYVFNYTDYQLKSWFAETKSIISNILARQACIGNFSANILFPRYYTDCTGKYGCGYIDICQGEKGLDVEDVNGFVSYK